MGQDQQASLSEGVSVSEDVPQSKTFRGLVLIRSAISLRSWPGWTDESDSSRQAWTQEPVGVFRSFRTVRRCAAEVDRQSQPGWSS